MKTKKRFLLPIICVLAMAMMFTLTAVALVGCGGGSVDSIELSKTEVTAYTGDTVDLTVTAKSSDGKDKKLSAKDGTEWKSSNESVATVSASGKVTVKAKGEATITVEYKKLTATCKVTAKEMTVELDETEITVEKGKKKQLTATAKVDGEVDNTIEFEWSTSDKKIATVDATGLVVGRGEGKATITAKRKGGNQSATCEVEGTWEKPVGYNPVQWAEQNKIRPNTWGYWNAKESSWAGGALAEDYDVYTDETFTEQAENLKDDYFYIGMGKATFEFEITNPGVNYVYQVFYRSSDNFTDDEGNKGELKFNHNYAISLKLESDVSGEIHINPYDDVREREEDESAADYNAYLLERDEAGKIMLVRDEEGNPVKDKEGDEGIYVTKHDIELEADVEQEINLIFKHDDCGYIYKEGLYDNMGSALHLQCGDLTPNERITLKVWDVQFKDLGECDNPYEDEITKHDGYIDPNATAEPEDLKDKLPSEYQITKGGVTATKASIVEEDSKAIFQIEGTLNLSEFNSDEEEAEEYLKAYWFDAQEAGGSWNRWNFEVVGVEVTEEGNFTLKFDITWLGTFSGGTTHTCHFGMTGSETYTDFKLSTEQAVHDSGITIGTKKYTISNIPEGTDQATNWGCVSIKVVAVAAAE